VGESRPTSGSIQRAENLRVVYFDQHRESLDPSLSLKRALAPEADSVIYRDRPLHVASWAKRFLFRPEQLETPVGSLSGGERARIVIARMMLQPADLLVLDEPTNDLDIPALDVLEESLLDFPGALVLVTHDRYLIDRVSTQILALSRTGGGGEGGGRGSDGQGEARHFADYDQWEANRRNPAQAKRVRTPASIVQSAQTAPSTQTAKPAGRRLTYLEQREWDGLEAAVLEAESKAAEARRLAEDPAIASDASLLQRRHADLADLQLKIDRLYARWAELEEKRR
jgi:ATP-binding cassette subfamily F protein uup